MTARIKHGFSLAGNKGGGNVYIPECRTGGKEGNDPLLPPVTQEHGEHLPTLGGSVVKMNRRYVCGRKIHQRQENTKINPLVQEVLKLCRVCQGSTPCARFPVQCCCSLSGTVQYRPLLWGNVTAINVLKNFTAYSVTYLYWELPETTTMYIWNRQFDVLAGCQNLGAGSENASLSMHLPLPFEREEGHRHLSENNNTLFEFFFCYIIINVL